MLALLAGTTALGTARPNLIMVVADDYGWADIGIRNPLMRTPHLDKLITAEGLLLERHYVFKFCSPTRSSLLSGRLPIHVNQENSATEQRGAGVMLNFTLWSEKLRASGYHTAQIGKWHVGQASVASVPAGRGFDSSLGFFNYGEDHYTQMRGGQSRRRLQEQQHRQQVEQVLRWPDPGACGTAVDLWQGTAAAASLNGTDYGGYIFSREAVRVVEAHAVKLKAAKLKAAELPPLAMYVAWQECHAPLQVPDGYDNPGCAAQGVAGSKKRVYCAMTSFMDEAMGNLTASLKRTGLWENTLLIFTADKYVLPNPATQPPSPHSFKPGLCTRLHSRVTRTLTHACCALPQRWLARHGWQQCAVARRQVRRP